MCGGGEGRECVCTREHTRADFPFFVQIRTKNSGTCVFSPRNFSFFPHGKKLFGTCVFLISPPRKIFFSIFLSFVQLF